MDHPSNEPRARAALDALPGLTWRPFGRDDLPAVAAFYAECETHDRNPERRSLVGLQEFWDSPRSRPDADTLVAHDREGHVVATAWAGCNRVVTERRGVHLGGAVRPDRRGEGIGGAVLEWQLAHGTAWDTATRRDGFGPLVMRTAGTDRPAGRARPGRAPRVGGRAVLLRDVAPPGRRADHAVSRRHPAHRLGPGPHPGGPPADRRGVPRPLGPRGPHRRDVGRARGIAGLPPRLDRARARRGDRSRRRGGPQLRLRAGLGAPGLHRGLHRRARGGCRTARPRHRRRAAGRVDAPLRRRRPRRGRRWGSMPPTRPGRCGSTRVSATPRRPAPASTRSLPPRARRRGPATHGGGRRPSGAPARRTPPRTGGSGSGWVRARPRHGRGAMPVRPEVVDRHRHSQGAAARRRTRTDHRTLVVTVDREVSLASRRARADPGSRRPRGGTTGRRPSLARAPHRSGPASGTPRARRAPGVAPARPRRRGRCPGSSRQQRTAR